MFTNTSFIRRALGLIWAASGRWMVLSIGLTLALGVLPAANVYLVKWVVDAAANSVGKAAHSVDKGETWHIVAPVLVPASLVLAVLVAQRLLGGLAEWVSTAQTQMVQDHIKGLIHEKSVAIDFSFFESPEYFDQFHQANTQASTRTLNLLRNLGALLQSAVTFLSIMAILMRYSVWLPLLLLVSSAPALWVLLRQNRRYHAWWKEMTPDRRWAVYFDNVLTAQVAAAELRINNSGDYFVSQHRLLRDRMRRDELRLTRQRVVSKLMAGFLGLCMTGLAMGWIAWKAMRGQATLGDVALFYQSISQSQTLATTLLNSMGEIHSNVLFLEQVFEYLDKGNLIHDPPAPVTLPRGLRQGVCFEGITFTYPDNERPSVQGLTLEIPAGKIIAVVGENGSGKSTLIKLLCRFYDPGQGRITLDGIDLRELAQHELRRQISVMFQFPVRYQLTVAQNILLGDLHSEHSPEEVRAAAEGAGAHEFIMRLPKQYDQLLGRSFEGAAELSGGEWQRLALARAFLRRAEIVVLDEPTSFMDSWSENEWLRRFRGLVHGRTALIITHRFTTAMQADVIHVMERGAIIESGTHEELLQLGGKYAESWQIQMRAAAVKQERGAEPRSPVRNGSE